MLRWPVASRSLRCGTSPIYRPDCRYRAHFSSTARRVRSEKGKAETKAAKKASIAFADLPTHGIGLDGTSLPPLRPLASDAPTKKPRKKRKAVSASPEADNSAVSTPTTDASLTPKPQETATSQVGDGNDAFVEAQPSRSTVGSSDDDTTIDSPRAAEKGPAGQSWPPLAKDVLNNMHRFPGCILLTRVGGFYEAYFEQAPLLAGMLSIKLANRVWGGRPVAMAGFPLSQLEKYLKLLVEDNRKLVAICEEFRPDEEGGEMASPQDWKTINTSRVLNEKVSISRRVTRVVSPGTLIDEKWMNPLRNNFILSISSTPSAEQGFGLAWLDLSTSDFHVSACSDFESLKDEVKRISPVEITVEQDTFTHQRPHTLPSSSIEGGQEDVWQALDADRALLSYVQMSLSPSKERADLPGIPQNDVGPYSNAELQAMQALTTHLRSRLLDLSREGAHKDLSLTDLLNPGLAHHHTPSDSMAIDSNTLDALEVRETGREGSVRGSLVSTVRRTLTKGGSRLLVEWLTAPSTSLSIIEKRHSIVEYFTRHPFVHEDLRMLYRQIQRGDVSRTLQRITTARNDEQDLLEIRDFIKFCTNLKAAIYNEEMHTQAEQPAPGLVHLRSMADGLGDLSDLGQILEDAIDERVMEKRISAMEALDREDGLLDDAEGTNDEISAPTTARMGRKGADEEPWGAPFEHLIRPESSQRLSALTREYERLREEASTLQTDLRMKLRHAKVALRFLLGQGFVVHLSDIRSETPEVSPDDFMTIAYRTKSTRSYYYESWTRIGSSLVRLQDDLKRAESAVLRKLRQMVLASNVTLRNNARSLDELDCLLGFAQLANEMRLVKPTLLDAEKGVFEIKQGRHIGVELGLIERGRSFAVNDLDMNQASRVNFITGPNMGGKSTFLRQNALIAILGQAGSFVPATSARFSIVDRLFSRVGAKDDLFRDRSTFMVEMLETSSILRRATPDSFIVADEIGRGTTTNVGIAIAFATLSELSKTGCRVLFASHLHELAEMMKLDSSTNQGCDEFSHVRFWCSDVEEKEDAITYIHALKPGVNRESHGLTVAALAGMPHGALTVARDTLEKLQVST